MAKAKTKDKDEDAESSLGGEFPPPLKDPKAELAEQQENARKARASAVRKELSLGADSYDPQGAERTAASQRLGGSSREEIMGGLSADFLNFAGLVNSVNFVDVPDVIQSRTPPVDPNDSIRRNLIINYLSSKMPGTPIAGALAGQAQIAEPGSNNPNAIPSNIKTLDELSAFQAPGAAVARMDARGNGMWYDPASSSWGTNNIARPSTAIDGAEEVRRREADPLWKATAFRTDTVAQRTPLVPGPSVAQASSAGDIAKRLGMGANASSRPTYFELAPSPIADRRESDVRGSSDKRFVYSF